MNRACLKCEEPFPPRQRHYNRPTARFCKSCVQLCRIKGCLKFAMSTIDGVRVCREHGAPKAAGVESSPSADYRFMTKAPTDQAVQKRLKLGTFEQEEWEAEQKERA